MRLSCRLAVVGVLWLGVSASAQETMPVTTADEATERLIRRGRDTFHLTWFEQAVGELDAAVASDPSAPVSLVYRAAAASFLYQDHEPYLARAQVAVAEASRGEQLLVEAWSLFLRGDYAAAVRVLESLVALHPADPYARHMLGFSLIDAGRPRDGVRVLADLIESTDGFTAARNHHGLGLLELGRNGEAEEAARRFVAGRSENPSAWDSLADVLHRTGRREEAIAALARAWALDPRMAYAVRRLGDFLELAGDGRAARAAYRRAVEAAGLYGPAFRASCRLRAARSWARAGQFDSAREAVAGDEESGAVARLLSELALADGDAEAARATLGRAGVEPTESQRSRMDDDPAPLRHLAVADPLVLVALADVERREGQATTAAALESQAEACEELDTPCSVARGILAIRRQGMMVRQGR